MTQDERNQFLYNYGLHYALSGGLWGAYYDVAQAFEKARKFKPYRNLNITSGADFGHFKAGYEIGRSKVNEILLLKAAGDAENSALLKRENWDAPNYLYDGKGETKTTS